MLITQCGGTRGSCCGTTRTGAGGPQKARSTDDRVRCPLPLYPWPPLPFALPLPLPSSLPLFRALAHIANWRGTCEQQSDQHHLVRADEPRLGVGSSKPLSRLQVRAGPGGPGFHFADRTLTRGSFPISVPVPIPFARPFLSPVPRPILARSPPVPAHPPRPFPARSPPVPALSPQAIAGVAANGQDRGHQHSQRDQAERRLDCEFCGGAGAAARLARRRRAGACQPAGRCAHHAVCVR